MVCRRSKYQQDDPKNGKCKPVDASAVSLMLDNNYSATNITIRCDARTHADTWVNISHVALILACNTHAHWFESFPVAEHVRRTSHINNELNKTSHTWLILLMISQTCLIYNIRVSLATCTRWCG